MGIEKAWVGLSSTQKAPKEVGGLGSGVCGSRGLAKGKLC